MAIVHDDVHSQQAGGIRWVRVIVGAFLLEVVLFAVLVPFGLLLGSPLVGGSGGNGSDAMFLTAVAIGCLGFGYVAGRLVARGVSARRPLHGLVTGVMATAMYLTVCALSSAGLSGAVAAYGTTLFWTVNLLRIVGTTVGAAHARRA